MQWRSPAAWAQPVVQTGEFRNGRWQTLETHSARPSEDRMQILVSPDEALSLLLVCEKPAAAHWHQALERALTDPASLP
jgi:hypothetical protein